jgi:hypothetical protein
MAGTGAVLAGARPASVGGFSPQERLEEEGSTRNVTPRVSNPHDYVNHIFKRP